MARRTPPVFLAQGRYRQRRLRDALWLMPVLGALVFAVPLLWPQEAGTATSNGTALVYLFGGWAALIALGAGLASLLRRDVDDDGGEGPAQTDPDPRRSGR